MTLANIPFFELNKPVSAPSSNALSHEQPVTSDNFFNILSAPENTVPQMHALETGGHKPDAEAGSNSETSQKADKITALLSQLGNSAALEQAELLLNKADEFGGLDNLIAKLETALLTEPSSTFSSKDSAETQNQKFEAFLFVISEFRKKISPSKQDTPVSATNHGKATSVFGPTTDLQFVNSPEFARTAAVVFPNGNKELAMTVKNLPTELTSPSSSSNGMRSNGPQQQQLAELIENETLSSIELTTEVQKKKIPVFNQRGFGSDSGNEEALTEVSRGNDAQYSSSNRQLTASKYQYVDSSEAEILGFKETSGKESAYRSASLEQKPEGQLKNTSFSGQNVERALESKSTYPTRALSDQNSLTTSKNELEPERQKTFSDDAYRFSIAELKGQKARHSKVKSIGQVGNASAIDAVVNSFSRALNASYNTQPENDLAQKPQTDEFSLEVMMPRSGTAQTSSFGANSPNSHSLEKLEKWLDSHLDLNSRGWVSNLSKSMLSALSRGQQRLTFMLSPESLGRVNVSLIHGSNGLDVRISAERQATAALIGDAEAKLVSSIEVTGQRVSSLTCSSSISLEHEYNPNQNASSNANRENSEKRNRSHKSETENSFETSETIETVGKSIDDDTIINITI